MWQLVRVARRANAVVDLIQVGHVRVVGQVQIDTIPASLLLVSFEFPPRYTSITDLEMQLSAESVDT